MEFAKSEEMFAGLARKWWVLLAVGIGTFMSALDGSVVNTILPVIKDSFSSSVAAVEWAVTIYLLVVSGLLLTFGRVGDLRGHKLTYLAGFGIFILGSGLCGLATSTTLLTVFRAFQALGAAMLFANSPAILTGSFPAAQRGQALGMQATMTYLGLTVGPSFGGWLANRLGWQAVFYINIPVGLLAFLMGLRFITNDQTQQKTEHFDVFGALTFMVGLITLLFALNRGADWGWTSPTILSLGVTAVVFSLTFIWIELHNPAPMLDLSLFKNRLFSISVASAVLNYVGLYSILFLLPFYLIQGRGLNSAQAGLLLTAQPLVMAVAAPISGALSDRIGSRLLSTLGMAILALGLFVLSRLGPQSSLTVAGFGLAVAGLGTGIFISPNTSALMGSAPKNRQGIASGVLATSRNVGMVLGIGLAGAILTSMMTSRLQYGLWSGVQTGLLTASGIALFSSVLSAARGKGS